MWAFALAASHCRRFYYVYVDLMQFQSELASALPEPKFTEHKDGMLGLCFLTDCSISGVFLLPLDCAIQHKVACVTCQTHHVTMCKMVFGC